MDDKYLPRSWYQIPKGPTQLKNALKSKPVAVAIEAGGFNVRHYSSGIIKSGCGTNLNHGVVAIGYGTDAETNQDYIIVKNSWGKTWGEKGFARIAPD